MDGIKLFEVETRPGDRSSWRTVGKRDNKQYRSVVEDCLGYTDTKAFRVSVFCYNRSWSGDLSLLRVPAIESPVVRRVVRRMMERKACGDWQLL